METNGLKKPTREEAIEGLKAMALGVSDDEAKAQLAFAIEDMELIQAAAGDAYQLAVHQETKMRGELERARELTDEQLKEEPLTPAVTFEVARRLEPEPTPESKPKAWDPVEKRFKEVEVTHPDETPGEASADEKG